MDRMANAKDADATKVGIDIAREMTEKLGTSVQGLQLSAPFGRVELALAIIGR
jgi:homocysteine S-methyltransferase